MGRTKSYYDLRDALAQPGCAVCRLKARAGDQYLASLLWENVNDPDLRQEIRQARGFCHPHTWGLARRRGASLGTAIIVHDVLQSVLRALEGAGFQALPAVSLRRAQESWDPRQPAAATAEVVAQLAQGQCLACAQEEKMEDIYLSTLLETLVGKDGLLAAYRASDGLCLPHFCQALARLRDKATFEALLEAQRAIWLQLLAHLGESIRKSDYRFRDEPRGEESGAWLRALAALVGPQREPDKPS